MLIINKIEELFAQLPEVSCTGCGLCCVIPATTLSEFIYLVAGIENKLSDKEIIAFLSKTPELHPEYEGNCRCIFLENNRCLVHSIRPGACRLFGIPSLNEMNVDNMEQCRNNISVISGNGDLTFITQWLDDLFAFESTLYPFGESPFFIKGFNLFCWFDILFDDRITQLPFVHMRSLVFDNTTFSRFKPYYSPQTNIYDKINKIEKLDSLLESGNVPLLKSLLESIRNDYPLTGTYFYEESQIYLNALPSV